MLNLRTFGSLDLHTTGNADGGVLLTQPRSTALFVYLLLARPRGYVRRDILCALFWPHADEFHARGALSQALTRIRHSAGADVLELRGKDELRVVPAAIQCDVVDFEVAIARDNYEAALRLYVGPFLFGFHTLRMPGFEYWAEAERDRLRFMAACAARALAMQNLADRRLLEARQAANYALELAPESEGLAMEFVSALIEAGDRVGALTLYDGWSQHLKRDLDLAPSDAVQALADELRASLSPPDVGVLQPSFAFRSSLLKRASFRTGSKRGSALK